MRAIELGKPARGPALLFAALVALTPAAARADALFERVAAILVAGYEPAATRGPILALGPEAEGAVVRVFESAEVPRYARLRALSALPAFGTETAVAYLAELVRAADRPEPRLGDLHPARSPLVLRRALEGLAELAEVRATTPALVERSLDHEDPHVRKAAVRLAAGSRDEAAHRMLVLKLRREHSPMVRVSLEQALRGRSARPAAPR